MNNEPHKSHPAANPHSRRGFLKQTSATLAGAGLLPHFLLLGAGLLGAVNMATGYSPAELSYTILIVQAVMIIVALTRLWRFLKRHLRDVDLSGRSGNE